MENYSGNSITEMQGRIKSDWAMTVLRFRHYVTALYIYDWSAFSKRLALAAANVAVSPLYFCGWLVGFISKSIRVSVGAVISGYRKGSAL